MEAMSRFQQLCVYFIIFHSLGPIMCSLKYDSIFCVDSLFDLTHHAIDLGPPGEKANFSIILWSQSPKTCYLKVTSCSYCQVRVEALEPFNSCPGVDPVHSFGESCQSQCPYLYFYDPDYSNQTARVVTKSDDVRDYHSESSVLSVVVCAHKFEDDVQTVKFHFSSQKKLTTIVGDATFNHRTQYLSSPFFPSLFVQNAEMYTYIIESNQLMNAFITITFEDFYWFPASQIMFFNASRKRVRNTDYSRPYIISNGPRMRMTLYTGRPSQVSPLPYSNYMGLRIAIRFYEKRTDIPRIDTNCGSVVNGLKGYVTTENVTRSGGDLKDCVWVVKKPNGYKGLQLTLLNFESYSGKRHLNLEIRSGLTSLGKINSSSPHPIYRTTGEGYYIRLRGRIQKYDLIISYNAYNYGSDPSDRVAFHGKTRMIALVAFFGIVIIVIICGCVLYQRYRRQRPQAAASSTVVEGHERRQTVEMSMAVSSAEYLPSYNEVMRAENALRVTVTCVSDLQPPSYEEVMENPELSVTSRQDSRTALFDASNQNSSA